MTASHNSRNNPRIIQPNCC